MELRLKTLRKKPELLGANAPGGLKVYDAPLTVWVEELDPVNPVLLHVKVPDKLLPHLGKVVRTAPVTTSTRASGIVNKRAVYGPQPRIEIRANCRACRFTRESFKDKQGFAVLAEALEFCAAQYQRMFPSSYEAALARVVKRVHRDWRWNKTPYLSINCNFNQTICCHLDSGNMEALSTVLIVSEGVEGGELDLPELGISLAQKNGALTLFRGDSIIHGVRPFTRLAEEAFRCSIVFYTLEKMKVCQSFQEEIGRANFLECVNARQRFSTTYRLELIKKARKFFKPEEFQALLEKWEKRLKAETP